VERKYSNLNEIRLRFKITDSGKGIGQKAIDDILTPFFNGQLASLKKFGIEGRGLFSAREILNRMKGKLSVRTGKEGGSVFIVDIPLFSTDPLNKRHYRLPDSASEILKVKIFDTNRSSASGLKKLFEYFRHEVSAPVSNRLNTVAGIDDCDIIIIPDKLVNEKIAAQIRAAKSKKELKLVLITDSRTHSGKRALELADGQIKKPFTQQMVFQLLINLYETGQNSQNTKESPLKKQVLTPPAKKTDT
jgi:vacuolar-type H+-ATPase subunit F/Vma7